MGAQGSDDEDEITGINVTPLVDVMLVLLVIFMMTTSYIVHKSITVNLPKADTGEAKNTTKNLAFALDSKSQLYLDGKPIDFSDISVLVAAAKAKPEFLGKELQALITADTATPHGTVVRLIDSVRKNGISEFALNVDAQGSEGKPSEMDSGKPSQK